MVKRIIVTRPVSKLFDEYVVFETSDGKQFDDLCEAEDYENRQKIKHKDIRLPFRIELFYLQNLGDLKLAEEVTNAQYYSDKEYDPHKFEYPDWFVSSVRSEQPDDSEEKDVFNIQTLKEFKEYLSREIDNQIKR